MNLSELFNKYQQNFCIQQVADKILFADTQKIFLQNIQGSSAAFIVSSIFMHQATNQLNHLIVLNDAEEAAYFFNAPRCKLGKHFGS